MKSIKNIYDKNGFVVIPKLLTSKEVHNLRKEISTMYFKQNTSRRSLTTSEIINNAPSILHIPLKENLVMHLNKIFNSNFLFSNGLNVQKNACSVSPTDGWHEDIQSQRLVKYINKNLEYSKYHFCKIGVYLQDGSCPFGASIDVFSGSHRWSEFFKNSIFYFLFSRRIGKFVRLFVTRMDKSIKAGDAVIFDSRLIHRSAVLKDKKLIQDEENYETGAFIDNNAKNSKLTIYFEAGNPESCKQYQASNMVRALVDEVGESEFKWFSDCLSMSSSAYPKGYIEDLKSLGTDIQFLEDKNYIKIIKEINFSK
jgi:hypothetical protein